MQDIPTSIPQGPFSTQFLNMCCTTMQPNVNYYMYVLDIILKQKTALLVCSSNQTKCKSR